MHAKGWGAHGTFTVTHDITCYTKAQIFSKIGKQTPMFARFSTVAGERGAADAERDIRGFSLKFYTEEGNWDVVGNNTPINQTLVNDLAGGGFIAQQRNVVLVGGTGTGKTHLAIAIARSCIRAGSRGRFFT